MSRPLLLVIAGLIAFTACESANQVKVGERKFHLECSGRGSPVVILECGNKRTSEDWKQVVPGIAKVTRVCSYDRAGQGKSDAAPPGLRTPQLDADDLHALLAAAREPGPYVLVGHSYGGFIARVFCQRYQAEVAGLVLVDATQEDFDDRLLPLLPSDQAREASRPTPGRVLDWQESLRQARAAPLPPELPLIVIVAGQPPKDVPAGYPLEASRRIWMELQQQFARKSQRGTVRVAERSGHLIPLEQPEIIVESVTAMVGFLRAGDR